MDDWLNNWATVDWRLLPLQAAISLGVYAVIKMNGRGLVKGWKYGAIVQLLTFTLGVLAALPGLLLALIPGKAFLDVYRDKLREQHAIQKREAAQVHVEIPPKHRA